MKGSPRLLLALILLTYAVLGVLYAHYTPPWQVPDEPAHYNYIRALAEQGKLPVMEEGDYDQGYLDRLKQERFPPDLSIEPLTYEDHQPPLFYLLAAPFYLLFDGALIPLRLVSVALGLMVVVIAYGLVRTVFPARPFLALTAAGLVALLPQHLAMMAGVNNDPLAEVILGLALWTTAQYVTGQAEGRPFVIRLGLTLGLALLTKTAAYVALPVALLALGLKARRRPGAASVRAAAAQAGWMLLVAALLAGPCLARNVALYGWGDPAGLGRHNMVVVGQPRTAQWLVEYGWTGLLGQFARTTFQSFWGQFGWMGVPLHPPVYLGLAVLSALLVTGFLGWLSDRRRPGLVPHQRDALLLLAASTLLTFASYVWYNVTFVQHQGRYLFPALIPLALGAALGLEWLLSSRKAHWAAAGLAAVGGLLVVWGLARGDLPLVPSAVAFGLAALFGLASLLPRWGRELATGVLLAGMAVLDVYALFWAIVPMLTR